MQTVLFCESSPNFGGQEQQILLQMAALETTGQRCILACDRKSRIAQEAAQRGLRWHPVRFRNSFDPPSLLGVRRLLIEHRVGVGICHSGHDANSLALASRTLFRKRQRLLRVRTYLASPPRPSTVNDLVDHTLVPSHHLRKILLEFQKIQPDKISVLNPIVPAETLQQQALTPLPAALESWIANRSPLVVQAAMLRSEKGHDLALESLARLVSGFPKLGYVVAGSGKKEEILRKLASRLGLSDHVFFAGLVIPVAPLLARADLVIMPSRSEPLGLAQMEALVLGVPVVVSNAGGLPETVQNGKTGWVLPVGEVDAWVAGLREALSNPTEAFRRASAGKIHVLESYSQQSHLRALRSFF